VHFYRRHAIIAFFFRPIAFDGDDRVCPNTRVTVWMPELAERVLGSIVNRVMGLLSIAVTFSSPDAVAIWANSAVLLTTVKGRLTNLEASPLSIEMRLTWLRVAVSK